MRKKIVSLIIGIALISIVGLFMFDDNRVIQTLSAIPLFGSLCSLLFVLIKDHIEFERKMIVQDRDHFFALGSSSHMANSAFDKHVLFCEEYIKALYDVMNHLFQKAATPEAMNYAYKLDEIRRNYEVWITKDVNIRLDEFERKLLRLGSNARFIDSTAESVRHARDRELKIEKNYEDLMIFLAIDTETFGEEYAIRKIIDNVKSILSIEDLTELRKIIISKSISHARKISN